MDEGKWSVWSILVGIFAVFSMIFLMLPSLIVIPISFGNPFNIVFPPEEYSLDIFRQLLGDASWLNAAWLSVRVGLLTAALTLFLALPAAFALIRGTFPGRRFLTLFLITPMMVPSVVIALGLYIYFGEIRLRDGILRLVAGHLVVVLPFVIVTLMVGLRGIDPNLERAASVMGAGTGRILRRVTMPLLAPSIASAVLFGFLMSFDEIVVSLFVQRAGYEPLSVKMFSSVQWEVSPLLAGVSTILTAVSVLACLVVALIQGKK